MNQGLPILNYHAFNRRRAVTSTDPSWFAETLFALREAGYQPIDLETWIARGRPHEPRGFALTFDDGLRSILEVAHLLASEQIPVTVFLVTDRVGSTNAWRGQRVDVTIEPTLDWSEIAQLAALGLRFAAHGLSHIRLDLLNPAQLDRELLASRNAVEDHLGSGCPLLAYPYGASSLSVRSAAARHFTASFGTQLAYATAKQDPHDLARIDAYYLRTRLPLMRLIEGRAKNWLRWRGTLRSVREHAPPLVRLRGAAC